MERFYLENLLDRQASEKENIITVFKARGFLMDEQDGKYYLSNNGTIRDVEYLDSALKEFHLGHVTNVGNYVERVWRDPYERCDIHSKIIRPCSIEIVIDDHATVESAIAFFQSTKRFGYECCYLKRSWSYYSFFMFGPKADVRELEPYVAYYVKAISSCGVYTWASCDGNHPHGGKIYVYSEYPSYMWHEAIWNYILQPRFGELPFIERGIRFNASNQGQIYRTVYAMADFLYTNRFAIRKLKSKTLENIDEKYRKNHSSKEIEEFYQSECERVLSNAVIGE